MSSNNRSATRLPGGRRLAGFILSMLMTIIATHALLSAGASAQAPPGCAACEQGFIYGTTGFAGSYAIATPEGTVGDTYCITQGLDYPDGPHASPVSTDYGDQATWAALMTIAAPTDEDKAAVSMRVHRDLEGNGVEWNARPELRQLSDDLWAAASAQAGPFSTSAEVRRAPAVDNGGQGVVAIVVRSAAGVAVPNATVALSGANLTLPPSLSTGPTGVLEIEFTPTAPGPWRLSAAGTGLLPTTVLRYDALRTEQTVVGRGPRTGASPAAADGRLDIPTRVTVAKLDAGSGAPLPGAHIEIRPAGSTGQPVTVTTSSVPVHVDLVPGDYTATETVEPAGYLIDDQHAHPFAVTMLGGEVNLVWRDTPATPTVSTAASATRVVPGASVSDIVTVSGLPPSLDTFELQVRYLGPVGPPADGNCASLAMTAFTGTTVLGRATLLIHGNGSYPTPAFAAPDRPGCTTFDVSGTAALWAGGPTLSAAPNGPGESVEVVAATLSTRISAPQLVVGSTIADRISVHGLPAWSGVRTLRVRLIGPVDAPGSGDCGDLPSGAFDAAPVHASADAALDAAAIASGGLDTAPMTAPGLPGCVTFEIEDSAPLWPGGPTLRSPRGHPDETALVRAAPASPGQPASTTAPGNPSASNGVTPSAAGATSAPITAPQLANTGPRRTVMLLAAGTALVSAGAGLLLLIPSPGGGVAVPQSRRRR